VANCLVCNNQFEPFISFGKQPIANGFLSEKDFKNEYFFEMKVGHCSACNMVQLLEQPKREQMFNENYAFFSSTSTYMEKHFKAFAENIKDTYLKSEDPFIVEMGSNDGIMLQNFKDWGIRHLGVEPSANVAKVAMSKGINSIVEFFDEEVSQKIVAEHGKADAFLTANVMCHIPYIHSIAKGIKNLLSEKGILAFEDPYMGEIMEKASYDQIYDEHVFFFSALSVQRLFEMHNMELIDVQPQITHGGSMRYILAHKGAYTVSDNVSKIIEKEKSLGIDNPKKYLELKKRIEKSRDDLIALLKQLKSEGKTIVGYGATSKSTTILNYCQVGTGLIDFISDTTPIKQGKFTPGMHIPVKKYEEFQKNHPDYALLFAWNHKNEILDKEGDFKGKWITHVPDVHVFGLEN